MDSLIHMIVPRSNLKDMFRGSQEMVAPTTQEKGRRITTTGTKYNDLSA